MNHSDRFSSIYNPFCMHASNKTNRFCLPLFSCELFPSFRQYVMGCQVHFSTRYVKLQSNSSLYQQKRSRYSRAVNEFEGYGNDVVVSEKQVLDWSYRLILKVFPGVQRKLHLWPQNPTEFGYWIILYHNVFNWPLHKLAIDAVNSDLYLSWWRPISLENSIATLAFEVVL